MPRDLMEFCPEYVADFDEIKAIAHAQSLLHSGVFIAASRAENAMSLKSNTERVWDNLLDIKITSSDWREIVYTMLRRYTTATKEDYEKIISCRLSGKFQLDIDYKNLTVVLKTEKKQYAIQREIEYIKDIFPCNMTFSVEFGQSL